LEKNLKNPVIEKRLRQEILPVVQKPGRYVGNELNIIVKKRESVKSHVVLAFPDVYEIGMSYVGFQLLYHILNSHRDIWAERVFAPWPDMEERLRAAGLPLYSLESFTPLSEFDVIGFTLQYELTYTNILNMLHLAGIPVFSRERQETHPFVIAGGPCSCNPEPLADFVDAFLIGDGEEAAVEIVRIVQQGKAGGKSREEILTDLAHLSGVYVPAFYRAHYDAQGHLQGVHPIKEGIPETIRTRIVNDLKQEFYPQKPIVPLLQVTHDRLSIEVMRGCTEGCRYCNAGMIYRPVRERKAADVLQQMQQGLANSGYNEVSFLSLSISDYSRLTDLMRVSRQVLSGTQVNVSFPSMRLDSFNEEIAAFVSEVRKSGFTFAPEAGSERLRQVINKNITEEDLFRSVEIALQNGWRVIKFYFMIGLPTETDEDVAEIARLLQRLLKMSKQYGRVQFNVSISPFSPKAHTPFQWERQASVDEIWHKVDVLKRHLGRERRVRLSWRDPRISFLEGFLGRADRRMGRVIYEVWQKGAKFDGWAEYFNYDLWLETLQAHGYDAQTLIAEIPEDRVLPWQHIDKGVSKRFLLKERRKAYEQQTSPDCKKETCLACGLQRKGAFAEIVDCYKKDRLNPQPDLQWNVADLPQIPKYDLDLKNTRHYRVQFTKEGYAAYLSHLDMARLFERAFRRAGIPVVYSQGFNPRPKISFGQPLALGVESKAEYFDVEISADFSGDLARLLNPYLPEGMKVVRVRRLGEKATSLSQIINAAEYEIHFHQYPLSEEEVDRRLREIRRTRSLLVDHFSKGRSKSLDIRPFIDSIRRRGKRLIVRTRNVEQRSLRIDDLVRQVFEHPEKVAVVRKRQLVRTAEAEKTPLDVLH